MFGSKTVQECDVLVVGGGTTGCTIAGRLAREDPTLHVVLIEAGLDNKDEPVVIQPANFMQNLLKPNGSLRYYYSRPSEFVAGRRSEVSTGAILGGGSSVNWMLYNAASASDYDDWNTRGWSFKELLPIIKEGENYHEKDEEQLHGRGGAVDISYGGHQTKLMKEYLKAAEEATEMTPTNDLCNYRTGNNYGQWTKFIDPIKGRRMDAAHAFVHPVRETQSNLTLITGKTVIKVLFEGTTAIGIEYCTNPFANKGVMSHSNSPKKSDIKVLRARKQVVLSAGAFGSAMILERSGVGSRDILDSCGIKQVVDLPGVGKSYEDHQLLWHSYRVKSNSDTLDPYISGHDPSVRTAADLYWKKTGQGILATNGFDAGYKGRPSAKQLAGMGPEFLAYWKDKFENTPDKPVVYASNPCCYLGDHSKLAEPEGRYMSMLHMLNYPASRGFLHITSANPFAQPDFEAGLLNHPADMAPHLWNYKQSREIARRMPSYRGELQDAHPIFSPTSPARCQTFDSQLSPDKIQDLVYSDEDDMAIEKWVRGRVATTWHSMTTCPMKAREEFGVVDPRLNVFGTNRLKVADLSICPSNMGCNTNSVAFAIGQKAFHLVAEDLKLSKGVVASKL